MLCNKKIVIPDHPKYLPAVTQHAHPQLLSLLPLLVIFPIFPSALPSSSRLCYRYTPVPTVCALHKAQSTNATIKPTADANPTPVNTSCLLAYRLEYAADLDWVATPAEELGMGIVVLEDIVVIVVLALPDVEAMPPVVPSMGEVLDVAALARAMKESMVRDLFVAGLGGETLISD